MEISLDPALKLGAVYFVGQALITCHDATALSV
jgi:hypothetical protein